MSVNTRQGVAADAVVLAPLAARTFAEAFGADNTEADLTAYVSANFTVARLSEELSDASARFLIAEIDGEPVGYAKLRWSDPPGFIRGARPVELQRIYVSVDWHGQGVGPSLLQRCIDDAIEMGSDAIWLSVWERNPRAKAFYLKWGFRKVGEQIFMLGSDPQEDWVMERDL